MKIYISLMLLVLAWGGMQDASSIRSSKFETVPHDDSPKFALPKGLGWHALPGTSLKGSGACVPNGFGGDGYDFASHCRAVVRAWSGATADTRRNRLILWGGGHADYHGNELYALELGSKPPRMIRLNDPTVPTNTPVNNPFYKESAGCIYGIPPQRQPQGPPLPGPQPNSVHSYGAMAYIANADRIFVTGGSLACGPGNGSRETWTISSNVAPSTRWVHQDVNMSGTRPGRDGSTFGNITDYDPETGLVLLVDTGWLYAFDVKTNKYSRLGEFPTSIYLSGVVDPKRRLFVAIGNCGSKQCTAGNGVLVGDIAQAAVRQQNWTAATMSDGTCAEFLAGGEHPLNTAASPGLAYDPVTGSIVGWPNEGNAIYLMTPDPARHRLTCTKLSFANGPPDSAHTGLEHTSNGTFGRFRYFPQPDAFVLVNDWDTAAYILRLR